MARQTAVNANFINELELIKTVLHTDSSNNIVSEVIDENTKDYPLSPIEWKSQDDMTAVEKYVNDLGAMKLSFTDQVVLIINVYYKVVRKRIPRKIAAFCGAHLADLL
ncbi:hypothetical protein ACTXT7_015801 [Hymenolepis weldensis]